jgi:hypothetical protein
VCGKKTTASMSAAAATLSVYIFVLVSARNAAAFTSTKTEAAAPMAKGATRVHGLAYVSAPVPWPLVWKYPAFESSRAVMPATLPKE